MHDMNRKFGAKYFMRYTAIFVLLCAGVFIPFWYSGKALVWKTDGASQYLAYLEYTGIYLREYIRGLLKGQFLPKLYDFTIGMGDDVGAVFRAHPLDFISVLVPARYTELLYQFLLLLRMYLAGFSVSVFGFYWKRPAWAVGIGSILYVFSGYVLVQATRHPTFLAPMILFPIYLIATEKVLRRESGLLFSFVTGLGFISNYYFMYICSIAMAVYVLLRFFDLYRENRFKNFLLTGIRLAAAYLIGVGLVAAALLPTLVRLGTSSRLGSNVGDLLVYKEHERYYRWFIELISPTEDTGDNTNLTYAVLALPALVLLFARKWKEHITLKIAVILEVICLLLPAAAWMLSGFGYRNNRWVFVVTLTVSFIVMTVADEFRTMKKLQIIALLMVLAVYLTIGFLFRNALEEMKFFVYGMAEFTVCTAALLFLRFRNTSEKTWRRVLALLVFGSVLVNGLTLYRSSKIGLADTFVMRGKGQSYYENSRWKRLGDIPDDTFYRVDNDQMYSGKENASIILGYNGVSMYNSVINGSLTEYLLDQEAAGLNALHRVFTLDGRSAVEELAAVKYYMTEVGQEDSVPYGYELREDLSGKKYKVYENPTPLSIGYTYDSFIDEKDYQQLTALEKQQVMLGAVVLGSSGGNTDGLEQITGGPDGILTVPAGELVPEDDVTITEKGLIVDSTRGSVHITYEKKAGYECYLHLKGLYQNFFHIRVDVVTSGISKYITIRGYNKPYSLNRENYLVNLGSSEEDGSDEVTLTFHLNKGYRLDDVEFCYVPLQHYQEKVEKLRQDALENVALSRNTVSGTVHTDRKEYMVFAIPYSKGWTAYVDGEKTELQKANVLYMGLNLDPGDHDIVLKYVSPGFVPGAILTGISWLVFLAWLIFTLRRNGARRAARKMKK